MARSTRNPPPSNPIRPDHTSEEKRRSVIRLIRRIDELKAFDIKLVKERFGDPKVVAMEASIEDALSKAFGHGTVEYNRYERATSITGRVGSVHMYELSEREKWQEAQEALSNNLPRAIALLEEAVKSLEEEIAEDGVSHPSIRLEKPVEKKKVFVVHGHDDAAKHEVARFLDHIKLPAIILQEQPSRGLTIIEKFLSYADEVAFSVVLLTPDDLAETLATGIKEQRARQNVVFELGYFVGKLGRGSVCLLRKGDVDIPSDLYGVVYVALDNGGGWKISLGKELLAAGLRFDANLMFS